MAGSGPLPATEGAEAPTDPCGLGASVVWRTLRCGPVSHMSMTGSVLPVHTLQLEPWEGAASPSSAVPGSRPGCLPTALRAS